MKNQILGLFSALLMVFALTAGAAQAQERDLENTLYMDLATGRVIIELRPDLAPQHVARVKELTRQGFYNGLKFHRVIEGFMAQTGDPKGDGTGGSGKNLPAEFSSEKFVRGTVGAARTNDTNSADSQFFITFDKTPHLNGQYTIWGQVVSGMELIDGIARGEPPMNPDKIVKMTVAADETSKAPVENAAQ